MGDGWWVMGDGWWCFVMMLGDDVGWWCWVMMFGGDVGWVWWCWVMMLGGDVRWWCWMMFWAMRRDGLRGRLMVAVIWWWARWCQQRWLLIFLWLWWNWKGRLPPKKVLLKQAKMGCGISYVMKSTWNLFLLNGTSLLEICEFPVCVWVCKSRDAKWLGNYLARWCFQVLEP